MVVNIDINSNDLHQIGIICWWMQSSVTTLEKPENQYSLGDAFTFWLYNHENSLNRLIGFDEWKNSALFTGINYILLYI